MQTTTKNLTKKEILAQVLAIPVGEIERTHEVQVIRPSECYEAMDEWAKISGIHWFEIAKGELPPLMEGWIESEEVLLFLPGGRVHIGEYYDNGEKAWWLTSRGFCHPTHWAYINYPEK